MKLKVGLLTMILDNHNIPNKYTKSYLALQNVIKLETDDQFKLPENILNKNKEIKKEYDEFLEGIPLQVVELYVSRIQDSLDEYVYIEYEGKEVSELKLVQVYLELESFYQKIYELACQIANYYNLEIKLNKGSRDNIDVI